MEDAASPHTTPARPDRRAVLRGAAGLGVGLLILPRASALGYAANERLDIGVVGVGGRGSANLAGVRSENVVALCDVDATRLAGALRPQAPAPDPETGVVDPAAAAEYARAREAAGAVARFADYRTMLDEVALDAVVVSTPDHTHACITADALARGLHVYCEKPLTHSVAEARHVTELAAREGLVTQMGTQIHAGDNYRRVVELVRSGAIGSVREVHVVCGKNWGGNGRPEPAGASPDHLSYDLWLGPRQGVPYHPSFHPASWRRYWPFGGGTLGDMACHYMDLPFWALGLTYPEHVEADGPGVDPFSAPQSVRATWSFPMTEQHEALSLSWYDGGRRPEAFAAHGLEAWGDGVLFVGDEGALVADYGRRVLLPSEQFADHEPPAQTIPASIGHHQEWIAACKGEGSTTCTFDYSGPLTETVLLGIAAYRLGRGFRWDAAALASPDAPDVAELITPPRAEGWELVG